MLFGRKKYQNIFITKMFFISNPKLVLKHLPVTPSVLNQTKLSLYCCLSIVKFTSFAAYCGLSKVY